MYSELIPVPLIKCPAVKPVGIVPRNVSVVVLAVAGSTNVPAGAKIKVSPAVGATSAAALIVTVQEVPAFAAKQVPATIV
jgi:hypothetical protein